jgi:hypothetical protein
VRLYLSSFRMGDHPEHLAALAGEDGRRAVVIANALDDAPADVRRSGVERELAALTDLGFDAAELDLRDYFGHEQRLRGDLAGIGLAWLRGGNVFMLRFALFRSAGDIVFRDLLAADALGGRRCRRGHADLRSRAGVGWPGAAQRGVRPALSITGASRDGRDGSRGRTVSGRRSRLPAAARRAGFAHQWSGY